MLTTIFCSAYKVIVHVKPWLRSSNPGKSWLSHVAVVQPTTGWSVAKWYHSLARTHQEDRLESGNGVNTGGEKGISEPCFAAHSLVTGPAYQMLQVRRAVFRLRGLVRMARCSLHESVVIARSTGSEGYSTLHGEFARFLHPGICSSWLKLSVIVVLLLGSGRVEIVRAFPKFSASIIIWFVRGQKTMFGLFSLSMSPSR